MLLCLVVVLAAFAGYEEHGEITGAVTLHQYILRVVDSYSVDDEIVGVYFRRGEGDLYRPYIVFSALHVDPDTGILHPGAAEFDYRGKVGLEPEDYAVLDDYRRDDGLGSASEVGQFLGAERSGKEKAGDEKGD